MPLIPRDVETIRLEMPDGDWYEMRSALGWYHRNRLDTVNAISLHMPWGKVQNGSINVRGDEFVPMTLEGMADLQLARMGAYIKAWSHSEPINANTLKRIPPEHAQMILSKIEDLEGRQYGAAEDSPLGAQSAS